MTLVSSIGTQLRALRRPHRTPIWIFLLIVQLCTAGFWWSRHGQIELWHDNPAEYTARGRPLMTSYDAYKYKWLRYAREVQDGIYEAGSLDPLMSHPDGLPRPQPVPLLSVMLARFAPLFGGDIDWTGIYLIPLLASLFVIPIGFFFYRIGYPAAGILAAFVGALSEPYLIRTSAGRVDTDALNLFFPLLASLFVLLAAGGSRRRTILMASAAGLTMLLFHWWYGHPGFTIFYLATLVVYLAVSRAKVTTIALSICAFVLCANPLFVAEGVDSLVAFVNVYLIPGPDGSGGLPDVYSTVAEARHLPWKVVLEFILNSWPLALSGLVLFGAFVLVHPRKTLPLLPLVGLGLLAFFSSHRFAMYLAPFAGAGIGYLITVAARWICALLRTRRRVLETSIYGAVAVTCGALLGLTGYGRVPKPMAPAEVFEAFFEIRGRTEHDAVLLSWWDDGLALEYITGRATFHDGMCQGTPKTYLIARALVSGSPDELHSTASFLDSQGHAGIRSVRKQEPTLEDAVQRIASHRGITGDRPVYLVFTRDMMNAVGSIEKIGRWDIAAGSERRAVLLDLSCQLLREEDDDCPDLQVDLDRGLTSQGTTIRFAVVVADGEIVHSRTFVHGSGLYFVEIVSDDHLVGRYLMDREFFHSNLHQMFVLGNYDRVLFEEVYNAFPNARMFRLIDEGVVQTQPGSW